MEDIIKRLNLIKEHYKLSGSGLARTIGMSVTSVNCFLAGKSKVSGEFLCGLLNAFPSISAEWLMRGNGTMFIEDVQSSDQALTKELADTRIKLLVQEGIAKELRDMILEKNNGKKSDKDEIITQKWEEKLG